MKRADQEEPEADPQQALHQEGIAGRLCACPCTDQASCVAIRPRMNPNHATIDPSAASLGQREIDLGGTLRPRSSSTTRSMAAPLATSTLTFCQARALTTTRSAAVEHADERLVTAWRGSRQPLPGADRARAVRRLRATAAPSAFNTTSGLYPGWARPANTPGGQFANLRSTHRGCSTAPTRQQMSSGSPGIPGVDSLDNISCRRSRTRRTTSVGTRIRSRARSYPTGPGRRRPAVQDTVLRTSPLTLGIAPRQVVQRVECSRWSSVRRARRTSPSATAVARPTCSGTSRARPYGIDVTVSPRDADQLDHPPGRLRTVQRSRSTAAPAGRPAGSTAARPGPAGENYIPDVHLTGN